MRTVLSLALLSAFLALPLPASSQCRGGACAPVGATRGDGWQESGFDGWLYRYEAGRAVAAFSIKTGRIYLWKQGQWQLVPEACLDDCACGQCDDGCECKSGKVCNDACLCFARPERLKKPKEDCPCDGDCRECNCAKGEPCDKNYGVDFQKIERRREVYRLNGREVGKDQIYEAIETGIPDDRDKLRLTVIGKSHAAIAKQLADNPAFAAVKDRVVVTSYPPDHWAVTGAGFVAKGEPTIYLQAPGGKVLHRQDDFVGGPEDVVKAIRKADPTYDAKKDPDLRKPGPPLDAASWWGWLVALGLTALSLLTPKR